MSAVIALVSAVLVANPAPASASGGGGELQAPHMNSPVTTHRPPALTPLTAFNPGADGTNRPGTTTSPALATINPLPAIDPGPNGAPSVPEAAVPQTLPVTPSPIVLPTQSGQTLVDATASDALNTMAAAGPYVSAGAPSIDANKLMPQVSSAQAAAPIAKATLTQLKNALLSGNFPPPLPIDPLALLQQLPNGVPQITYRVCSESATKPVSCSITLPLGVPALVNVTGDGSAASPDRTPDVLVDMVPMLSVNSIVTASKTLLSDQSLLAAAVKALNNLINLMKSTSYVKSHPDAQQKLQDLQNQVNTLTALVKSDLATLLGLVNVGFGFLQSRLATSEVPTSQLLKAHVWAVYDIPGYHRLSVGFDGYRRGAGLSKNSLGVFTISPAEIAEGIYEVQADLLASASTGMAITAGISSITQNSAGNAFDPTVASILFSPVPLSFSAHAKIDPNGETDEVDARSSSRSLLDALVFSNRHSSSPSVDQYTEAKINTLPNTLSATLTRPTTGGSTTVSYRASQPIDSVLFANYQYAGSTLQHALQATANGVPASIDLSLTTGGNATNILYNTSTALSSLGLGFYDQSASLAGASGPIVARGALSSLPTHLTGIIDQSAKHVNITGNGPLGAASLQASFQLGAYAPMTGDHATYIGSGKAFGVDAAITGFVGLDAYYDDHPRVNTTFSPGGQSFVTGANVDNVTKIRATVSNLPAGMNIDINPANSTADYSASSQINDIRAAYVNTTNGPSLLADVQALPATLHAAWTLGSSAHVHYDASANIPQIQFFASPQGVETVDPQGNEYLSATVTDIPKTVDASVDFANSIVKGASSDPLGSLTAAARFPFSGREWTAVGGLTTVPATFQATFGGGNFDFHAISGPLGAATLTVSNHGSPMEPTSPAHLALHYNQVSGDIDASAAIINLTEVGYTRGDGTQQMVLQADIGANPLQLDANIVLVANNVDDTDLSVLGSITGLPSNVNVTFASGKITYSADKHVGIQLGAHAGKHAALAGLGAPLPANGIAAVAGTCATGPGCASDSSPFCSAFPQCVGAVANINMSGLPTSVTVDTGAGTVAFTGYQPPAAPLTLYVRLIGIISALPDVSALATLSGLPSSLDFTAGPFTFGTGDPTSLNAQYHASAPLGTLSVDVDATTTNATFPLLRANATISKLPADMSLTGSVGSASHITVSDSDTIPSISAQVTNATSGYLQASITDVPKTMDFVVDVPNRHASASMSSAITDITVLAHVPISGRIWSAFAQAHTVPGQFTTDFGNGAFDFHALSGPLGSATFAVTNHDGATVPNTTDYLAAHYDQLSGDIDAGAKVVGLSEVSYSKGSNGNQTFGLVMGAATVGLDADIELTANGARDTRFAASGTITTPNSVHVDLSNGHIVYHADTSAALALSAAVGKVAALTGLGAPLYSQGVGLRAAGCSSGLGCASDSSPFCSVFSSCFGAVANVNFPGLPTSVDIDTKGGTVNIVGLHPSGDLKVFGELDNLISSLPQVRALATLSGLPNPLDIKVGPFGADQTDSSKIVAGYQASGALGSLLIDADAQTTTDLGTIRGELSASNLPKTFSVSGKFGSQTHIHVANSSGIDDLRIQATATLQGSPASGLIDFTDIPATMDMDIGAAGTAEGVNVPTFTYTSPDSTLDGLAQLDANLTQNVGPAGIGTDGAYFRFTNLGGNTTVSLDPDTFTLNMASTPATDSFQLGANLHVNDIPNTDFSKQVFDELATQGYVEGHYGARPSSIDDIELDIENMSTLKLQPGKAPFGLPTEIGLLFPGVSGNYGTFSLYTNGVNLHPDVHVQFRINDPIGDDHVPLSVDLPTTINDLVFHRFDDNGPKEFANIDFGVACVSFKVNPEDVGKSSNFVTLNGSDGPQTFNFIDINDIVPDILVTLIGAYTSPFMDIDISTDLSLGSC